MDFLAEWGGAIVGIVIGVALWLLYLVDLARGRIKRYPTYWTLGPFHFPLFSHRKDE